MISPLRARSRSRSPLGLPQAAALQFFFDFGQQFLDRKPLQVLGVKPFELRPVEYRIGAAHALQREFVDQLLRAQKFFVSSGRPAQQRKKISERLRQETIGTVHIHVGRAVAFRKTGFVRAKNQRHVRKNGWLGMQRAVQQHLFRSIRKVIRAANHMGNPHIDVVDDHSQLVHGLAEFLVVFPGAQQNKVLDFLVRKLAFPEHRVEEFRCSPKRNFEADRRLHARRRWLAIAAGTARDAPRPAGLRLFVLRWLGVVSPGIFFRGAVAQEGGPVGQAFFRRCSIQFRSL